MTHRSPRRRVRRPLARLLALLLPALLLPLLLPGPAFARGGRYAGPAQRGPSAEVDEPTPPPAAAAAADEGNGTQPAEPPMPGAPAMPTMPEGSGRRPLAGRRAVVPTLGTADWLHWYESNRERFEDLRAAWLQTEDNPVFAVGDAQGPAVGRVSARIGDKARTRILAALVKTLEPEASHWIHTEAASFVALGKVAVTQSQLTPHYAALASPGASPDYLQESAVLGLGHLGRSERDGQLRPAMLDRARGALFDVLGNPDFGIRTRAFAGVSLGLLADQPSIHGERTATWTAERLFQSWITNDLPDEVEVGVLLGLARIKPDAVPRVMKLVLEGCALRGRDWPKPASALVRAHAMLALSHLGDASNAKSIQHLLTSRRKESALLTQSAALAAGILGARDEHARPILGPALVTALDRASDPGTRHLILSAMGRVLAADVETEVIGQLEDAKLGRRLLDVVRGGNPAERSFAAIASALAAREVDADVASGAWQMFRFEAIERFREEVDDTGNDAHTRAAFCLALGLALDRPSGGRLLELLADEDLDPELRAYAGLALGLMGDARRGVGEALTKALADPRSDLLRMRAATALGLLAHRLDDRSKVVKTLLAALQRTRSQVFKGQIAVTLGRIGDARAIAPLIEILEAPREAHMNRAIAAAALGLVGEEALSPALRPTREHAHFMAGSAVVRELLDLL